MTFSFSSCQICIIGSIFQMKTWILKRNYVASLLMSWNQEIKELKFEYRSLILKLICNFTTVAETSLSECIGLVFFFFFNFYFFTLVGVDQWIECWTAKQKVASSVPSQGTCLGCGPGPQLEACERQPIDVSLRTSMFLSLSFSLFLKIN